MNKSFPVKDALNAKERKVINPLRAKEIPISIKIEVVSSEIPRKLIRLEKKSVKKFDSLGESELIVPSKGSRSKIPKPSNIEANSVKKIIKYIFRPRYFLNKLKYRKISKEKKYISA